MCDPFLATRCERIPEGLDEDVVIWAWDNGDIASSGMPDFSAVAREFDIHIRYECRVLGRVRNIYFRLERKRGFRSIQDA